MKNRGMDLTGGNDCSGGDCTADDGFCCKKRWRRETCKSHFK